MKRLSLVAAVLLIAPPLQAALIMSPDLADSPFPWIDGCSLVADQNGDGIAEIMVVTPGAVGRVVEFFAGGQYVLDASPMYPAVQIAGSIDFLGVVGDVGGGPQEDLLFRIFGTDEIEVRFDLPSLTTSTVLVPPGVLTRTSNKPARDFDGDGLPDFTVEMELPFPPAPYLVSVPAGSQGQFRAVGDQTIDAFRSGAEVLEDINGDGFADLAYTRRNRSSPDTMFLAIQYGGVGATPDGPPDLLIPLRESHSGSVNARISRHPDLNGDGEPDVVAMTNEGAHIVFAGTTLDGVRDVEIRLPVGVEPHSFGLYGIGDVGDTDGDGARDLGIRIWDVMIYRGGDAFDIAVDYEIVLGPGDHLPTLADAGDWDGDGRHEILVDTNVYAATIRDCNGDGIGDGEQVGSLEDCNGNGFPDSCEAADYPAADRDQNQRLDSCEIAEDPSLDCNQNGVLDIVDVQSANYDCDANGVVDTCELPLALSRDCDQNDIADVCELSAVTDCNANAVLDRCELAAPNTWVDCNGSGTLDSCELDPSTDTDGNGRLDGCDGALRLYASFAPDHVLADLEVTGTVVAEAWIHLDAAPGFDPSQLQYLSFEIPGDLGALPVASTIIAPGVVDWDGALGRFFLNFSVPPDFTDGPVPIAQVSILALDSVIDGQIGFRGYDDGQLPYPPPAPYWASFTGETEIVGQFHSAWVNRSFEDCNGNEIDDALEIAWGFLVDVDGDLVPDICEATGLPSLDSAVELFENYPNPFNPLTTIRFRLTANADVVVDIHDLAGRVVRRLLAEPRLAGTHEIQWNGQDERGAAVASGVYTVRLKIGGATFTSKMVLVR